MAMSFASQPSLGVFNQVPLSRARSSSASQPISVGRFSPSISSVNIAAIVSVLLGKFPSHNLRIGIDQAVTYGVREGRKQLDRRYEILLSDQMVERVKKRGQMSLARGNCA